VLYVMSQERLARTLFPLGDKTKAEVRALAAQLGLVTASKPESQEICFVPTRNYRDYLAAVAPETRRPGPILDLEGRVIGQHEGIAYYTIGQRKGLGLATGVPLYVVDIWPEANALVVGPQDALFAQGCLVEDVNFVALPGLEWPLEATARIRYRAEEVPVTLWPAEGDRLRVQFERPQRAVTPGQAIVFYHDDVVLAGGTIARRLEPAAAPAGAGAGTDPA
ncbi:MAG TPA: tRNA methyl transferase PRC-barrel domain-containing protein, partial [Chloroflexota bacterium]|nr:tRNA methyl transferase PRC-barrel domain-containing protein [Chloroflexota bacterium]